MEVDKRHVYKIDKQQDDNHLAFFDVDFFVVHVWDWWGTTKAYF